MDTLAPTSAIAKRLLPVPTTAARPSSATSGYVGLAGIGAALASIVLFQAWLQPGWMKSIAILAVTAVAMLATDAFEHRRRGAVWAMEGHAARPLDMVRVGRKLIGFWLTVAVLAVAYGLIPNYADAAFVPFKEAALACLPALLVISPFYIAYVDRRQSDPDDAYLQIASLLAGVRPADWTALRQHALGWMVKAFFLPLMFGYVTADLAALWSGPLLPRLDSFEAIFARLIDLFYLLDVVFAAITYTLTLRLFDTHIRSVEPSVGGWLVCLMCYPPFNAVTGSLLPYDQDNLYWGKAFAGVPALYLLWGSVILALVLIYMLSTAAFGLRFSNLTHRGIITNGPYGWTKHPAYIAKNLSWWLISVPFIAGAGWLQAAQSCLLLAGVNLIYLLRAKTEERHLSRDPVYRDYVAFIAREGLLARLSRRCRLTNG